MPGEKMRKRNPMSMQAVSALHFIQRTENINDPQYLAARKVVSDAVAAKMKIDAVALDKAWSRAPRAHQIAVLAAITQLDVPYLEGKEYPYVFMDCSGLMWYAWRTAGVDLPRQSVSQMDHHMRVDRKDAIVGNIVGEGTHIHMYLGVGNAMIHAPFDRTTVRLKMMSEKQAQRVVWTNPSLIAIYRL
jgi:cell wall-associated NlpC family hydrolase